VSRSSGSVSERSSAEATDEASGSMNCRTSSASRISGISDISPISGILGSSGSSRSSRISQGIPIPRIGGSRETVIRFTKLLPGWLRRSGVRRSDLDDAVQEASLEVLEKLGTASEPEGLTEAQLRHELMRIVSNVALRVRRRLQREGDRYSNIEPMDTINSRDDEEAWVEARALVLSAIEKLDEPTRALIFAHEIEGRTNVEIATRMNLKEDAVEYRVHLAKQRLRSEVEQLEQGRLKVRNGVSVIGCFGLVWQSMVPLDRALIGATHEALQNSICVSGRARSSRSIRLSRITPPSMPTTALMGALVFAPMVPANPLTSTVPEVKRISSVELPPVPSVAHTQDDSAGVQNAARPSQLSQVNQGNNAHARNAHDDVRSSKTNANVGRGSGGTNKRVDVRVPKSLFVISVPESKD
jgi:RNA polymerase sigma factor (sigma-70 family)